MSQVQPASDRQGVAEEIELTATELAELDRPPSIESAGEVGLDLPKRTAIDERV